MRSLALLAAFALVACGGESPRPATAPARPKAPVAAAPSAQAAPADALGPRPVPPPPAPYTPPVPTVYTRPSGMTVWLLERHALPIVSMEIVVHGAGSAADPPGKGGVAYEAANMLDEGAGSRGALELARDTDRLGATLRTGATADYAFASLTVLAKNLAPATAILGDVVTKPRFSPAEWARVHTLWANELKARAADPAAVANVVAMRQLYGDEPYGHPTNGTTTSAAHVALADVKRAYRELWDPRRATCVVVGDVTRAALDPLLDRALGAWKPVGAAPAARASSPPRPPLARRVVVVDRPDAPQSVIQIVRPGVSARSPEAPVLGRANVALGGSFTSRLNQDLREEHGWTYGARSYFTYTDARGAFVASAAVQTAHTGEALAAMLKDIAAYAASGPTDAEVDKTRLVARGELVESFEGADAAAHRLARDAGLGLPADHAAKASAAMYAAGQAEMSKLAAIAMRPDHAVVVIVGPRAAIAPQLEAARDALGAPPPPVTVVGPEGE